MREIAKNQLANTRTKITASTSLTTYHEFHLLGFIFSHSALREGWDNPNVFQICTLNESRTEMRKRQEIGRGLRLPVDASGERSFDPNVNNLVLALAYSGSKLHAGGSFTTIGTTTFGGRPRQGYAQFSE